MHKFHCLNNISESGLKHLTDEYQETALEEAEAILVRSADMKEMTFSDNLLTIARAGAGVNNIPLDKCAEEGIVVFNTPGANANAVKELVIAGMLLASRDIVGGIEWLESQEASEDLSKRVEKQKKQFAGHEIAGKRLGIIGLGAIGIMVANTARHLDMEVYGYDPYISVEAAWNLSRSIRHVKDINELFAVCDYISIHVPQNDSTKGMINADAIAKMKDGVIILNFARGGLVDEQAMIDGLKNGKVGKYVTDFVTPGVAAAENTLVIPHLGASTEESEDNCAEMAVRQIRDYLENGNITNSVNYPQLDMGVCAGKSRVAILHRNIPNMIAQFTGIIGEAGINISNFSNKSRDEYAYCLIDVNDALTEDAVSKLQAIEGVLRVRVL